MSSITDNHEIIDTLQEKGWTLEEVVKMAAYYDMYIDSWIKEHVWHVKPKDLADRLRNKYIDYDKTYVTIHQNGDMFDVKVKYVVGRNRSKLMRSPIVWKAYKNNDEYMKIAKLLHRGFKPTRGNDRSLWRMLRDYVFDIEEDKFDDDGNYRETPSPQPIHIASNEELDTTALDKEMQKYIDVLSKYNKCDCAEIKSIYNLGLNAFIVELDTDNNEQIMYLPFKDICETRSMWNKRKNTWSKNKESSKTRQNNIDILLKDAAKALVKLGVKSLTELKRITVTKYNKFILILENGCMYDVSREGDELIVTELETQVFLWDEDMPGQNGTDEDDDYMSTSEDEYESDSDDEEDQIDFSTDITFVDEDDDYPDEPINTDVHKDLKYSNELRYTRELADFNDQPFDYLMTRLLSYIQDNLDHWKCKDILEIKYIRFYPKTGNYKIIFENGSEIRAHRNHCGIYSYLYMVAIANPSPFKENENVPYYRRPVNALKTIRDLLEKYNITTVTCVYQIDINGGEFVIHLVNDTRIAVHKSYYLDGLFLEPDAKVVTNKRTNKHCFLTKDELDPKFSLENSSVKMKSNIKHHIKNVIRWNMCSMFNITDIAEITGIKYYSKDTMKYEKGTIRIFLNNDNIIQSAVFNHIRETKMVHDHPRDPRFASSTNFYAQKRNVDYIFTRVANILRKKLNIFDMNLIDTMIINDGNFIINLTDKRKIALYKVYGLTSRIEDEKGEHIYHRKKEDKKEISRDYKKSMRIYKKGTI